MTGTQQLTAEEAIRQVISAGHAMDYIDVVEMVQKKFGMTVSIGLVEQVCLQLPRENRVKVIPQIRMGVTSKADRPDPPIDNSQDRENLDTAEDVISSSDSHLVHALKFVKSVNGLQSAKDALAELELIMKHGS